MLQLIQSNRSERLLDQLAERLTEAGQRSPVLAAQTVLVQSQGMRQYLTLGLTRRKGIVANLDTPMPAAFLWQVCRQVMGAELPEHSAFDKGALCWRIMALLPGMLGQTLFEPLRDYLAGHQQEQLQRYQLAYRIADVFDQYLVYRPDWILAWERGGGDELPQEQAWQPVLWRALVQAISGSQGGQAMHRANIHEQVRQRLLRGEIEGASLPGYVAVFGLSSLPPQQLDLLAALAEVCPVDVYAMNPCEHYWGDIVSQKTLARHRASGKGAADPAGDDYFQVGNPLLASWGDQGRDFFDLLVERDVPVMDCYQQPQAHTLLHAVQQQILRLQNPGDTAAMGSRDTADKFILAPTDNSLQVHSCHSPMREVEVLRDQLLAMFQADAELRTRDVLVMVPDITAYAPYVHAVFSHQGDDAPRLRYSISDRSSAAETPLLRSFMALVDLPRSRFSAPEIVDLLEVPAIGRRFGFAPADINRISYWIELSGIRWAWDGDDKQQLGLPPDTANTWQFGLDRLFLGYAMPAEDGLYQSILPSDEVDSSSGELLGRLQQFLETLRVWRQAFQAEHSWSDWCGLLNRCLDELFTPVDEEVIALDGLRQAIAGLLDDGVIDCLEEAIGPALLRSLLQQCLDQSGNSFGFLAGGISFCSLMPMRSIPFRVVCILGMNDQQFPRQQSVPGFDLVAADTPRRGDRDRRSDDRYQMLEALLSARDRLMISYVGRDVLDNSDKVASVLLSELLDYCQHSVICEGDGQLDAGAAQARVAQRLLTQHYLQPFDHRYFQAGSSPWFSFSAEYFAAAAPRAIPAESGWQHQSLPLDLPLEPNSVRRIQLDSLLAFVANSCQTLLRQRLGVYLDIRNEELSDTEVLQLDNLQRFKLAQDAVTRQLQGVAQRDWQQLCRSSGVAPLGTPGQSALTAVWSSADEISLAIQPLQASEPHYIHVSLDIDDYRLEGELGPVYEDCLLSWRAGSYRAKQTLQQWLRHNLANAGGQSISTRFVGTDGEYWFEPIAADAAKQWLNTLLQWYVLGQQRALPLFPITAWQWLEARAGNNPDGAMDKARQAWFGNQRVPGEGGDAYFSRFYRWPVIGEEFARLAVELVEPARIARQQQK